MQRAIRAWQKLVQYWDGFFVIFLATWLRLSDIHDPYFITDQGRALLAGRSILRGELLTWGPQTSVTGIALGPLYYYWSAVALLLSNFQVWGPALSVALANVLAIALTWAWLRRYWGQTAAVVGAGVWAVSGLATLQSQIALEPAPLPLFVALWLWCLTRLLTRVPTRPRLWWAVAWVCVLAATQLNGSAVILAAVTGTLWWWQSPFLSPQRGVWTAGLGLLGGLISAKAIFWGSTPAWFWWASWEAFISPTQPVVALSWLLILLVGVSGWLQRKRLFLPLSGKQRNLFWLLGVWGCWILLAFSAKTVSGDHAMNLLFVWLAAVIGVTVQFFLPAKHERLLVGFFLIFLVLRALFTFQWIAQYDHPRVSTHESTLRAIETAAAGTPYALVYRGHLDVYDAADDHLQYLLWLRGVEPAVAARVQFDPAHPEYCERWIAPSELEPVHTVVVTAPVVGQPSVSLESAPTFLCQ